MPHSIFIALVVILSIFHLQPSRAQDLNECDPTFTASTLDDRSLASVQSFLEIPKAVLTMAERLNNLSAECANKIWPGSGVGKYQTVLVDPITKQPWLWRPKGFLNAKDPGGIEKIDPKELEKNPEFFRSKYSFANFRGKKTVGYLMNETAFRTFEQEKEEVEKQKKTGRVPKDFVLTEEIYNTNKEGAVDRDFTTLVHEGFHAYGQGTHHKNDGHDHRWDFVGKQEEDLKNGVINRYSDYPLEAGPRYFRRMQFEAMSNALLAKTDAEKQKFISEAAYWQDQYKTNSEEYKRTNTTDISEGSAKYFDFMASIYSKHGCKMDSPTLNNLIQGELKKLLAQLEKQGGLPPVSDVESYNIGLLANLLLNESNGPKDWKEKIMADSSKTPLDLLVAGKKRVKGADNEQAREMITQMQKKTTEELAGLMNGLASHAKEKEEWVRVQLPESAGAYKHVGYYKSKDVDGAVIAASASKNYTGDGQNIMIENISLLMVENGGCPESSAGSSNYIFVPKSSLKTNNGKTEFSFTDPETAFNDPKRPITPKAEGSGEFQTITDSSGTQWLCQK